jgi:hypothetical protein
MAKSNKKKPGKKLSKAELAKKEAEEQARLAEEEAAAAAALAEQERLEEERKRAEEAMMIPIEVPRYGTSDVRGMLVRTFQDLYAMPNLGVPEVYKPPEPVVEEPKEVAEPEPVQTGKGGKKAAAKTKKGAKKSAPAKKVEEEEEPVPETPAKAAEVAVPPPTEEELALQNRILARANNIESHLEKKLKTASLLEDKYIDHIHVVAEKEADRKDKYEAHGLLLGLDIPGESTFFNLDETIKDEGLINLDEITKEVVTRVTNDTMPRIKKPPPREKREKSKQALAQEEFKKLKEQQMETERLAKYAKKPERAGKREAQAHGR